MKKLSILIFFWSINILSLFAQRIDNVWPFGYDCCNHPPGGTINLDFSGATVTINQVQRHMNLNTTCGSACDSLNNLLFTSNGDYIANALDDTMMNGSGLNPSYYTSQHKMLGLTLPQANLVIPSLSNPRQFILFHNTIDDYFNSGASLHLYYSVIDMSLNSGLGAVISKNTVLYSDSMVSGRITACKHANGRDWWIVVHKLHSNQIVEFLYTPDGIYGPWFKNLITPRDFYLGQCGFNQQGNTYVYFDDIALFADLAYFDRCTGDFSNRIRLDLSSSFQGAGGVAFSQSGRYLYISSVEYLFQYDLLASNIDSSRLTVGTYDGFSDTLGNGTYFYLEQLAPDGKIYMSCSNSTPYLHVINYPDSAGLACGFCQHCISLPVFNAFTIPNFPNYYLGAETGTVCDTLTGITDVINPVSEFLLFPNPTNRDLYLTLSKDKIQSVSVYNSVGQIVLLEHDIIKNEYLHFDVSKLESGFYYLEVLTNKERVTRKFVRE